MAIKSFEMKMNSYLQNRIIPCTRLLILFRLYWHKLKTVNYITKFIMFSHNCVDTPRKTTSCSQVFIYFSIFDKILLAFLMHSLIMAEVKKFVSPFLSTATFLMSSSRMGQRAFVGWVMQMGPEYPTWIIKKIFWFNFLFYLGFFLLFRPLGLIRIGGLNMH